MNDVTFENAKPRTPDSRPAGSGVGVARWGARAGPGVSTPSPVGASFVSDGRHLNRVCEHKTQLTD